jgi:cation:H+ antiporter
MGNLIGSNIFNIASVLGITTLIHPIALKSKEVLTLDMFWMIGFAFILLPLAFFPNRNEIGRVKGLVILTAYLIFVWMTFRS